jgi:phosphoesterase RecJ-like protein
VSKGNDFFVTTHRDPDADGVASVLAFGNALRAAGKRAVLLTEKSLPDPLDRLRGAESIVQVPGPFKETDAVVVMDCSDWRRLGAVSGFLEGHRPVVNIDHHETNERFGDLNLVDPHSSSTAELVLQVIREANLPVTLDVAENVFAAIQTDTGSFRYENTTSSALQTAADMMTYGVKPWEVSEKIMDGYSLSRLNLLRMALDTVELHHDGAIGVMTVTRDMYARARAQENESERFVEHVRFLRGVQIAVLIRQTEEGYKFSLRSNHGINVAKLASRFLGGGHARAAGFEYGGPLRAIKDDFLQEAARCLNGKS